MTLLISFLTEGKNDCNIHHPRRKGRERRASRDANVLRFRRGAGYHPSIGLNSRVQSRRGSGKARSEPMIWVQSPSWTSVFHCDEGTAPRQQAGCWLRTRVAQCFKQTFSVDLNLKTRRKRLQQRDHVLEFLKSPGWNFILFVTLYSRLSRNLVFRWGGGVLCIRLSSSKMIHF